MARSPRTASGNGEAATPGPLFEAEVAAAPAVPPRTRRGAAPVFHMAALVAALVAASLWGIWVTKSLAAGPDRPTIAKVQLSGIVGEYVQAQARSATPPEQVTTETRAFMGEVQRNLEQRGASGQIVLVGEAVLAGNVPDITTEVRREVYARVKMPQAAAASGADVMGAMRAAIAGPAPQAGALGGQGNAAGN